jgi:hypothetical protein
MLARGSEAAFSGALLAAPPQDDTLSAESLARFEAAAREFVFGVHGK